MLKLVKPFDRIRKEAELLEGVVEVVGVSAAAATPQAEIDQKLAMADILIGDIDMRLDDAVFDKTPRLRCVVCRSIGVDFVDLGAANRRNILVVNSPEFCVKAVAEYTIGMMFMLARDLRGAVAAVEQDNWDTREDLRGIELEGRIIGLLGFGRIGREVARRAMGLGMRVMVYDPFAASDAFMGTGAEPAMLEEILARADVLSVHVPITDATRGMIGSQQLAAMKDGAIVINASRGGIVDEAALVQALRGGKLRGAALDAMTQEPPQPGHVLYNTALPNLLMTPHAAWNTKEAGVRNAEIFVQQVRCLATGQLPPAVVNRDITESWMKQYASKP